MARAALRWNTQDLARAAEVGGNTVNRFEAGQDTRLSSYEAMKRALEAAGVTFTSEGGRECVCYTPKAGPGASTIALPDLNASNDE